ncbi:MAG: hypothetical protein ACHQ53_19600, partial [Polyangiales bacterium]
MRAKWVLAPVVFVLALAPDTKRSGVKAEPATAPPAAAAAPSAKPLTDAAGYDPSCARLTDDSAERRMQDALDAGDKPQ